MDGLDSITTVLIRYGMTLAETQHYEVLYPRTNPVSRSITFFTLGDCPLTSRSTDV